MIGQYFSYNGTLKPLAEATVSIDDLEFTYGYGVYETLRFRNNILYHPELHAKRLLESARIIGITHDLDEKRIIKYVVELTASNNIPDANIKMLLLGGKECRIYIMMLAPLYPPSKLYSKGCKVITSKGERLFVKAKTLNMLMSYLAYTKAKENDAYDALLVDNEGNIREGTRTNFFFTDGNTIYTPPRSKVLDGVSQKIVIDIIKENNIQFKEKDINAEELNNYQGYFLTSTSSKIIPISCIDDKEFSIPEIIRMLMKLYDKNLDEYKDSLIKRS